MHLYRRSDDGLEWAGPSPSLGVLGALGGSFRDGRDLGPEHTGNDQDERRESFEEFLVASRKAPEFCWS